MDTKSLRSRRYVMEKKYNEESDEDISDWEESNDSNDSDEDFDRRSDKRKTYACDWIGCGKRFGRKRYIKVHQKRVHLKNSNDCETTEDVPKVKSDKVKKGGRPPTKVAKEELKCDWMGCGYVTSHRYRMTDHKKSHSKEQPFKCEECGTRFKMRHGLKEHILYLHSGRKLLVCEHPRCDWTTRYPKDMKDHMTRHSAIRHFTCDYTGCDKTFFNVKSLNHHKKYTHISPKGSKTFTKDLYCEWPGCGYTSKDPSSMFKHRECHKDYKDRRYVCDWPECGKRFTSSSNLRDHMGMHTNDKRYSCQWPGCEFRSVLSGNVNKHLRTHTKHMNENDRKEIEEKYRIMKNIYQKKVSIEPNNKTTESKAIEEQEVNVDLNNHSLSDNNNENKLTESIGKEVNIDLSEVSVEKEVIDNTSYGQTNDCSQVVNNDCNQSMRSSTESLSNNFITPSKTLRNIETNIGNNENTFSSSIIEVDHKEVNEEKSYNSVSDTNGNETKERVAKDVNFYLSDVLMAEQEVKYEPIDKESIYNDLIGSNELHNDCNEFDIDLSEIHIKKETEDSSYEDVMNDCFNGSTTDSYESDREVEKTSVERCCKTKKNMRIKCKYCGKRYKYYSRLQVHIKNIHKEHGQNQLFKCEEEGCLFSTEVQKRLNQHLRMSHKLKLLECDFVGCGYSTTTGTMLRRHQKIHSAPVLRTLIECQYCDKTYKESTGLRKHMMTIHMDQCPDLPLLQCKENGCQFTTKSIARFNEHAKIKHLAIAFKCEFDGCDYMVGSSYQLKRHMKSHSNYMINCDYCDKTLKSETGLQYHLDHAHTELSSDVPLLHCQEEGCLFSTKSKARFTQHNNLKHLAKTFKCEVNGCDYVVGSAFQLKRHMKSSSHHKLIKCHYCDRTFRNNGHLYNHIDHTHSELCRDLPDLTCEVEECQFKTKWLDRLKRHLQSIHKSKVFVCGFDGCGKQLLTRGLLVDHRKCHPELTRALKEAEESGPFNCLWPGCDKTFTNRKQRSGHMNCHDRDRPVKCQWLGCERTYVNKWRMRAHLKTHTSPRFPCSWPQCGKTFLKKVWLSYHLNLHSGAKPFKCVWPGCDEAFAYPLLLRFHTDKHSGLTKDKRFKCHWPGCEWTGGEKQQFDYHMTGHQGLRPFECHWPGCEQRFRMKQQLSYHMNTHNNVRPFRCKWSDCDKAFNSPITLRQHYGTHIGHPFNAKTYKCPHCSKTFRQSPPLYSHINYKHKPKTIECDVIRCNSKFSTIATLNIHKKKYHR